MQRLAGPGRTTEQAPAGDAPPGAHGSLIVEDEASAGPGQMRRTEFLTALRPVVCAAADAELARVGRDTTGCPYLERAFAHYASRGAATLEEALLRFAPEAARATTARDYLPAVADRVRAAAARWADTGQLPDLMGGAGNGLLSRALPGAVGGLVGAVTSLFALGGDRSPRRARADASDVRSRLGGGEPLPSQVRTRMERSLGHDFSRVRVHSGAEAAAASSRIDARAFTVGEDVAFAAGHWRPGTLVGDAILAHELAHVVQQSGGAEAATAGARNELEDDADRAAAGAVASTWGARGAGDAARAALPRLRSGLRLQRCASAQTPAPGAVTRPEEVPLSMVAVEGGCSRDQRQGGDHCCTAPMKADLERYTAQAASVVDGAIRALRDPATVRAQFVESFGAEPSPSNVETVLDVYTRTRATLRSRTRDYMCRDFMDRTPDQRRRNVVADSSSHSTPAAAARTKLFGCYEISVSSRGARPYLFPCSVRTLLHEAVHAAATREGEIASGGSAGEESYSGTPGFAPSTRQADSYMAFAFTVSGAGIPAQCDPVLDCLSEM